VEDVCLFKAYVNVTLNPIDGVGQTSSKFWEHIHRKYCAVLTADNPAKALRERDSDSLKIQMWRCAKPMST
jgi:hypothetical protein